MTQGPGNRALFLPGSQARDKEEGMTYWLVVTAAAAVGVIALAMGVVVVLSALADIRQDY